MNYHFETRCQHLAEPSAEVLSKPSAERDHYGAVSFPIYQTSTFAHRELGSTSGYDYTRQTNPTRNQLERIVASLEEGADAAAFASGMAAISVLMELFAPGDHIITCGDMYGGSRRLFHTISEKNGIVFSSIDLAREDVRNFITDDTKAVFLETPTNPMMEVIDIRALADQIAGLGILLIVDNTFLSPYLQKPLLLGADIVVHSGTKYLGGHNDTSAGFLVVKDPALGERFHFLATTTGAALCPLDSWLVLRGIKTLPVRMDRAQENALRIAQFLKEQPHVTRVLYPGLVEHPGYAIMKKQSTGFGAIITFETDSEERAHYLLGHGNIIQFAESLGGTETLITYPITQTHADLSGEELEKSGLNNRILRLSVGLENAEDLIEELGVVLNAAL